MLYSVTEIAKSLDISRSTVYRQLQKAMQQGATDLATQCNNKMLITSKGFEYLQKLNNVNLEVEQAPKEQNNNTSMELLAKQQQLIISMLQEQIKTKDIQIKQLMQQAENYQVLLLNSQQNALIENTEQAKTENEPKHKRGLFSRLFKN